MTSIKAAKFPEIRRVVVAVYVGPDPERREHCGNLHMAENEADELIARIDVGEPDPGHITPDIAAHVLFHFDREGGYQPSDFKRQLLLTIGHADQVNRALLARAYPAYVAAFNLAQTTEDGTARLQQIARGES